MSSVYQRTKDRTVIVPYIFRVFPAVERELNIWRNQAALIPEPELKRQALASIEKKRFHCQGGSIYALYTADRAPQLVRFIVALQTISDYLDNLCDRVAGAGDGAFRTLHQAMIAAVDIETPYSGWYADYPYQDDGGYLNFLVQVSREVVVSFPGYADVREDLIHLIKLYSDLQVYKHMEKSQRVEMLVRWYSRYADLAPDVFWWEFSAATGSTLGVFALAAMAAAGPVSKTETDRLLNCYFPWLCGIHILLDYFIDLDEDLQHGDLNFVSFYPGAKATEEGLTRFLRESLLRVEALPRPVFHRTVTQGLLALYLSDTKALCADRNKISQLLLRHGGPEGLWLHRVCTLLRSRGLI